MDKVKMVIFKQLGKFYCTELDNYNSRIKDKRKILDFSSFDTVEQIKEYWKKYIKNVEVEFIEV